MNVHQAAITQAIPAAGRYLFFTLNDSANAKALAQAALTRLKADGEAIVLGLGAALVSTLGGQVEGLSAFPSFSGAKVKIPATRADLCCWLCGADRAALLLIGHEVEAALAPAFRLSHAVDAFRHRPANKKSGHDLTGYEDGTENPKGKKILSVAINSDGGSMMVVQEWRHHFQNFAALSQKEKDHTIGRRQKDNVELEHAPASAHVKRTAQENFEPEAWLVRRSMPYSSGMDAGLMFVAFARSFAPFQAQMRRMAGLEDGVVDAIFKISKPVSGAYFWCPPIKRGWVDWRQALKNN